MVSFDATEKQLSIEELGSFEAFAQLTLPSEFRNHLLKYNGGKCNPCRFVFLENGTETISSIDWFLAIYDGKYDNMFNYYQTYKVEAKRMPANILPIAHDQGGNLICISCVGHDVGYIYFWDHENEVDYSISDDSDYGNLYLVAKSFDEFLSNLH
jgi:hypothetical protein